MKEISEKLSGNNADGHRVSVAQADHIGIEQGEAQFMRAMIRSYCQRDRPDCVFEEAPSEGDRSD